MDKPYRDAPRETDGSLVLRARDGDDRAFAELAHRYKPLVGSVLGGRLSDPRDIEDQMQETFLRAHRHLRAVDVPERFAAWLARIAANCALSHVRRVSRRYEEPTGERERLNARQVAEAEQSGGWRYGYPWLMGCEAVRLAVCRLPDDCRHAVVMWAVEGCSYVDVAERLGVSEKAASARIRRAIARLRAAAGIAA